MTKATIGIETQLAVSTVLFAGIGIGFNLDRFIKIIVEGSNDFAVVKRLNWMIETMAIAIDTNTVIITNGSH